MRSPSLFIPPRITMRSPSLFIPPGSYNYTVSKTDNKENQSNQ